MRHCLILALITVFGYKVDAFWLHTLKDNTLNICKKMLKVFVSVPCHNERQTSLQVN